MVKPLASIITDLHLKKENFTTVLSVIKQASEYNLKNNIYWLFIAGDLFTSREAQPLKTLKEAHQIFDYIDSTGLDYRIIPGNHDKVDLNDEYSYIHPFLRNTNKLIDIGNHVIIETTQFSFLPYYKEGEDYLMLLQDLVKKRQSKISKHHLITHIAVNGVKNNDGSLAEGIEPNLFQAFDKVFVGHYHDESFLEPNIYYIGSSHQANYGEDEKKGFTVVYDNGDHELIETTYPRYVKLHASAKNPKDIDLQRIAYDKLQSQGHYPKLVLSVEEGEEMTKIEKQDFAQQGILMEVVKPQIEEVTILSKGSLSFDRKNILKSFDQFCAKESIDKSEAKVGKETYLAKIL